MKKTLSTIIAATILTYNVGCSNFSKCFMTDTYIPEYDKKQQIENAPYIKGVYVCIDKAIDYQRHLFKKGYTSRVVIGHVEPNTRSCNHAWVEVYNSKTDRWHMIDPTWKHDSDGWPVECMPERKVEKHCKPDIENRKQYWYKCKDVK